MVVSTKKRQLCVPSTFYFPDIDATVVHLNHKTLMAHVYLIQVTISQDQEQREDGYGVWSSKQAH